MKAILVEAMTTDAAMQFSHEHALFLFRSPREFQCFLRRAVVDPGWRVEERFTVQPVLAQLDYRTSFLLLMLAAKHVPAAL